MKKELLLLISLIIVVVMNGQPILYGISTHGGTNNHGKIFTVDVNTSNMKDIFSFEIDAGIVPGCIRLLQADNGNLYGLVSNCNIYGNYYYIFEFDPFNSTYDAKYKFEGGYSSFPRTGLTQALNGKIYGTSQFAGDNNKGFIFEYNIQNGEFLELYRFQGFSDGKHPMGSLLKASDGLLYGITNNGGQNAGTIFSLNPESFEYTVLAKFNVNNGRYPEDGLIEGPDGLFYGMTSEGGDYGKGVIYSFNPSSLIITKLFDFDGVNGALPKGKLIHTSKGNLLGLTFEGGYFNHGVLFRFNIFNKTFEKIIDLNDSVNGSNPGGSLLLASDGRIYGLTSYGGEKGGGCLFEYNPSNDSIISHIHFSDKTIKGSLMQATEGKLYGTRNHQLFEFDIFSKKYTNRMKFGSCLRGRFPFSCLTEAKNGKFYGTTIGGGQFDNGVLFKLDPITNIYTPIIDFEKGGGYFSLVLTPEGQILGTNSMGGENKYGYIFVFDPDAYNFNIVAEFDYDITGSYPTGELILCPDGNYYGRTVNGGAYHGGGIYRFIPQNNTIQSVHDFKLALGNYKNLALADNGNLYGVERYFKCGGPDPEYIFEFNPVNDQFNHVFELTQFGEVSNRGIVTCANNNKIYGLTAKGGDNGQGILFEYDTETGLCVIKHHFEFSVSDYFAKGKIMQASNGNFYGIASNSWNGILFEYDIVNEVYNELASIYFSGSGLGNSSFCFTEIRNLASLNNPLAGEMSVYPNPFKDNLIIEAPECQLIEFNIFDLKGSKITSGTLNGKSSEQINLTALKPGLYFIEILGEDLLHTQKIIKTQ